MPSTNDSGLEIVELWTSRLLNQSLPGHERHTQRLAEIALAHDDQPVFSIEDASLEWLKAQIGHGVNACLERAGFTRPVGWSANARFDVERLEDYRCLKNHPGAYFTGFYVVRTSSGDEGIGVRDDRSPSSITYYDPRAGVNMNAISRDPYIAYNHTYPLAPGQLLIWPAYVAYFLHPNLGNEPAIRIAFDIRVQAVDENQ